MTLVKERGVSKSQAARDLGIHVNVLRKWILDYETDANQAFPGRGKMRPDDAEVARLKRELAKTKAERDILKKPLPTSRRNRTEVCVRCEAPRDLGCAADVRGARCLARRVLRRSIPVDANLIARLNLRHSESLVAGVGFEPTTFGL